MLFITIDQNGKAIKASKERDDDVKQLSRWDYKGLDQVTTLAQQLTAASGEQYLPVDSGPSVSPRFDIIEAPKVGEHVSMGFNGDYYPVGKITGISDSFRVITTSDGKRFFRRRQSGTWRHSKTWSLVTGVHNDQNPHF